jgi:flagellar assembly protein FliH
MSADSKSRVMDASNLGEVERWQLPDMQTGNPAEGMLTAKQIENLQQQAYDQAYQEGFEKGYNEGLQSGQKEAQENVHLLQQLMSSLATPFKDLDDEVEQDLLALTMAMAQQIVRREIKLDPSQIIAVIREAIAALPIANRTVQMFLHPEDAALVKQTFSMEGDQEHWQIVEDPGLSRGGCRIATENSNVDATVETRLAAIFARVVGGERENDET